MTLGGLLALGYNVVVSYKRASTSVNNSNVSLSLETIDTLGETFMVLRGTNRKVRTLYSLVKYAFLFIYLIDLFIFWRSCEGFWPWFEHRINHSEKSD